MLRSSHDPCGCSTQTTSTINLKRSTLHPHEGQADRPNTPSDSVNLGSNPGPPASYYVLDIAYVIVFLGSLVSREFAGVTGLVFKAIRGRDGCTRDFACGRYENLSGAISWLTFLRAEQLTSGEAEVIGGGNSQNRGFVLSESRGAFAVRPSRPAAAASGASMSGR